MYDRKLVFNDLNLLIEAVSIVLRRTTGIQHANDFLLSEEGVILLDSVCMKLIAIGEGIKKLDKITGKSLLNNYPEIDWKGVMAMRDIIVHHYFEVDVDVVFQTVMEDLPVLRQVLEKMRHDMMFI
ncbi:MAG: HepT-like ribonuclease domain-containing protein [Marinifilaceae bacterium]|nr:HepT-like ribonuclease domain-containing protein [Marinifilaceae bacterium]